MYKLYMNERGRKPMTLIKTLNASEADAAQVLEAAVAWMNNFPRQSESQFVLVQDGLIVAVEGLTTRKPVWTN